MTTDITGVSDESSVDTTHYNPKLTPNAMPALPPPISIILVCKNPGPRLAEALESFLSQRDLSPELIVIDGASTDGTVAWLEQHRARLAHFSSAPDTGVYDAMNRAVALARGEWILFLGADDCLTAPEVLALAAILLARTPADIAAGEAAYTDGRIYTFDPDANPCARNFIHHQAAFYRRALFAAHGAFDPSYTLLADYEFNLRLHRAGARFASLPLRLAICGIGGLSDAGNWRTYREEIAIRHRYFPLARSALWDALSVVRFIRKKIVRRRPAHG
jgi:glycosyltransferase involved in cell wall biosynthesis